MSGSSVGNRGGSGGEGRRKNDPISEVPVLSYPSPFGQNGSTAVHLNGSGATISHFIPSYENDLS